jgi:hypothetical protein
MSTVKHECQEILDQGKSKSLTSLAGLISAVLFTVIFIGVGFALKFTHPGAIASAVMALIGCIIWIVFNIAEMQSADLFNKCQAGK